MRRRAEQGQALVELAFVILLFLFVAMMGFETGVVFHNINVVSNALKQGAWVASRGAQDEMIMQVVSDCDSFMMKSAWFDHRTENFSIEVYGHDTTGQEFQIAPTQWDAFLSPNSTTRAAYVWRAKDMNIRIGLRYVCGYVAPFMSADPMFRISLPLVASMPIAARNDEDRDGLADLYERELFLGLRTAVAPDNVWMGYNHTDTGIYDPATASDRFNYDVDRDDIPDSAEAGHSRYDYDNDGFLDAFDRGSGNNALRHPVIGGEPLTGLP